MEMNLPYAYHHFAEGESPDPPFLLFLSPRENTFGADNLMYHSFKQLDIELYTDRKSPETEQIIEDILTEHHIFYATVYDKDDIRFTFRNGTEI